MICVISYPAGQLAALCVKNIGHYMQFFQPNIFILAMFVDTIDFYHLVLYSVTLILAGGLKIYAKQVGFILSYIFELMRMISNVTIMWF